MGKETGYPSIDKIHLEGTKYGERKPIIPSVSFSSVMDLMFFKQGDHKLVDSMDLEVSTKEFQKDSLVMAKFLLEIGVRRGDIVSVSMPNYYQAIPIFKACNMIGAVCTFLNPYAHDSEIINYIKMYDSKVLFNFDKSDEENKYIKKNTGLRHIITMDKNFINSRDYYQVGDSLFGYRDDIPLSEIGNVLMYRNKDKFGLGKGKVDALILYTSGSTGKSKSMVFTNENLIASCIYLKNSTHVPEVTEDDKKWMNVVPFMYPYGFGASVLQTMLSGREVILSPNLSEKNISYFYGKKPNLVFGSPAFLELTKRNIPDDMDLSSLKTFVSGGDFLSVSQSYDAREFFKKHGAEVNMCNSSGTGETLGCSTNAMNIPYRPETVGQLVLGPEYVILNPDTLEEVKYMETGVLCTRGKHVFKGYYNNQELTDSVKIKYKGKEYYMTGNIGFLDKDRYFTLVGRASRFFIVKTLNKVYCELVQAVVSNIPGVDSCAIVPKANDENLFCSKAYVVLKEGYLPTKEMEQYIIEMSKQEYIDKDTLEKISLKDYEIPVSVTFLDKLPRTELAEKVDYEKMRRMAQEEYDNEKRLKLEK